MAKDKKRHGGASQEGQAPKRQKAAGGYAKPRPAQKEGRPAGKSFGKPGVKPAAKPTGPMNR